MGEGRKAGDDNSSQKYSLAQVLLLIEQYIDNPLAAFALCLDSLLCLRDLTLRFTECKGGEVSLQSIPPLSPLIPFKIRHSC